MFKGPYFFFFFPHNTPIDSPGVPHLAPQSQSLLCPSMSTPVPRATFIFFFSNHKTFVLSTGFFLLKCVHHFVQGNQFSFRVINCKYISIFIDYVNLVFYLCIWGGFPSRALKKKKQKKQWSVSSGFVSCAESSLLQLSPQHFMTVFFAKKFRSSEPYCLLVLEVET